MNIWNGVGNLVRDPELRRTRDEQDVCTFTIAVSRARNNRNHKADYFRITTWNTLAANCYNFLQKGSQVAVYGPLYISSYEKKDGTKGYSIDVWADSVEFIRTPGAANRGEFSTDVMPVGTNAHGDMSGWTNPAIGGSLSDLVPADDEDDFPL